MSGSGSSSAAAPAAPVGDASGRDEGFLLEEDFFFFDFFFFCLVFDSFGAFNGLTSNTFSSGLRRYELAPPASQRTPIHPASS